MLSGKCLQAFLGFCSLCLIVFVTTLCLYRNVTQSYSTGQLIATANDEKDTFSTKSLEVDGVCLNILYYSDGNISEHRVADTTSDDNILSTLRKGCVDFKRRYFFEINENQNYISDAERGYPIAYSLLVHQQANQLAHLLSAIYAPQNIYCVHVDRKSSEKFKDAVRAMIDCLPNVFVSSRSEDVVYASFSRLQADINCMDDLLNSKVRWRYLINLCGQDFPLYTNHEIVKQLMVLKGRNSIGGHKPTKDDLERTRFVHRVVNETEKTGPVQRKLIGTTTLKSPPPFNFTLFKNNAYNIFSRRFLQWAIRDSEKAKALLDWCKDTRTPDEHFWRTLESIDEAPDRGVRGDQWQISRYIKWIGSKTPCHGFWRHYNCVFGARDVANFKDAHVLFANKFDISFDSRPISCLRKWLDQRKKRYDQRNPDKAPKVP